MKDMCTQKHALASFTLLVCGLAAVPAHAEPLRVVSPPGLEQEVGDDNGTIGDSHDYYHVQSLHPAAAFAAVAQLPASHQWLVGFACAPTNRLRGRSRHERTWSLHSAFSTQTNSI